MTDSALSSSVAAANELLRLIDACDNFPYPTSTAYTTALSGYWLFALLDEWNAECTTLSTYGYSAAFVVEQMPWTKHFKVDRVNRTISIPFCASLSESEILEQQLQIARKQATFRVLKGWRDELYRVLGIRNRVVVMERAGSALFGITSRGSHCMAYTWASTATGSKELKIIIPRRAATKSTYPLMLDNTIAGGMASGEYPWVTLIREAEEETGLSAPVTSRAVPVGSISYMYVRDARAGGETGLFQPECQYCYDLELSEGVANEEPQVSDDEVVGFEYMTLQQAWNALIGNEFKPNSGLVLIDFLIRRGYIRAGRDEGVPSIDDVLPIQREGWDIPAEAYREIVSRLHRKILFESTLAHISNQ